MNKIFAVFLCAAVLLGTGIQGNLNSGRGRCLCPSAGSKVPPRLENLVKVERFAPNVSCDRVEIIVTLKTNRERKCLNPKFPAVQQMLVKFAKMRASRKAGQRGKEEVGWRSPQ